MQHFNDILLSQYDIRQCRMIYLLRKYDIISVPSYAEGIYHRTTVRYHIEDISPVPQGTDIIVKNLFCQVDKRGFLHGGGQEIRTLAPVTRPTPLAGEPLHHLSNPPCGKVY